MGRDRNRHKVARMTKDHELQSGGGSPQCKLMWIGRPLASVVQSPALDGLTTLRRLQLFKMRSELRSPRKNMGVRHLQ